MAGALKVVAAIAVGTVAAGGVALASGAGPTTAVVAKVVDGDTIDVTYDGELHRVRLLNVDTPESVDPNQPVECLGPEATEFLRDRLPKGTEVRLEFDEERYDRYDRELAGVFLGDSLVNAEIARAGLGVAVSIGANRRFYGDVLAAQEEARSVPRGLYADDVLCTLPAQVEQLQSTAEMVTSTPPSEGAALADLESYAAELAAAARTAGAVSRVFDGDRDAFPLVAFAYPEIARMDASVAAADEQISQARSRNRTARAAEQTRLEGVRKAEEARKAAEEAARKAAEEAARQAAEEAARAAEARRASSSGGGSSSSGSGSSSRAPSSGGGGSGGGGGGYDGYTGCRAYGSGGTSIDEQGRRYTKIDCVTKQPI